MTIRINIIVLVAVFLLAGASGWAAQPKDQEAMAVVLSMKDALKLKDSQVREILPVFEEYFKQIRELKDGGGAPEQLQRAVRSLREDLDADLAHYLSGEQMAAWKASFPPDAKTAAESPSSEDRTQPPASSGEDRDAVLESPSNETNTSGIW